MRKSLVFLCLFIPGLWCNISSQWLSTTLPLTILGVIDFLSSILLFIAWAFLFWNLGAFFQSLYPVHEIEFPGVIIEEISLFVQELGHNVYGKLMTSKNFNETTPLMILLTGGGGRHEDLMGMGSLLVKFGVKVLLFDHPGSIGKSHGSTSASKIRSPMKSILALHKMMDHVLSRADINTRNIGLFGGSLGAITAVYGGFTDERVNLIIGQNAGLIENREALEKVKKIMPLWFKVYCKLIKLDMDDIINLDHAQFARFNDAKLSARVYLTHTKDDTAIPFDAFIKLKGVLRLPEENCLVFEKGGHFSAVHQETIIGWIAGKIRQHLL
nr:hypothetical protein [Candidatus Sigynarchaeota archaeon]